MLSGWRIESYVVGVAYSRLCNSSAMPNLTKCFCFKQQLANETILSSKKKVVNYVGVVALKCDEVVDFV